MLVSEFDYNLPEKLIAQTPSEKRENSRMMVLKRENHEILHRHFFDVVDLLDENDVLIPVELVLSKVTIPEISQPSFLTMEQATLKKYSGACGNLRIMIFI